MRKSLLKRKVITLTLATMLLVFSFGGSIPLTNGAFEFTFVNNFRLIGQGTDNNLQVHQNVHVTIDANGFVTTTVDNASVDCN